MTSSPPVKRFNWTNLRLRIISAAILAPSAVLAVWLGSSAFLFVLLLAVALLAREWTLMSAPQTPVRAAAEMAAAVVVALIAAELGRFEAAWGLIPVGAALVALLAVGRKRGGRPADEAFGVFYLGAPALALLWLRSGDPGRAWTLVLLATTWAADIAAFVAGNTIGGAKLWPQVSPNKTWSGFVAGLFAAMVAAELVAIAMAAQAGPSPHWAWLIGLVLGLATMAGDLWESMIKRRFGVKDSGSLIPGHGGLLDRVDGLMFATLAMSGARAATHYGVLL